MFRWWRHEDCLTASHIVTRLMIHPPGRFLLLKAEDGGSTRKRIFPPLPKIQLCVGPRWGEKCKSQQPSSRTAFVITFTTQPGMLQATRRSIENGTHTNRGALRGDTTFGPLLDRFRTAFGLLSDRFWTTFGMVFGPVSDCF